MKQRSLNPIAGELRHWYVAGKQYGGKIYGSKEYEDGKFIYTAIVKEVLDKLDYFLVKTYSGSQWICYKDKHHPTKKDVEL